eukprot:728376-Amphidinium_carterae.3
MPQVTMPKHFNKVGIHQKYFKINALGSASTPDEHTKSTPLRAGKKQNKDYNQPNGEVHSTSKCCRCDTTRPSVKPCEDEGYTHHDCGIHQDWVTNTASRSH